MTTPQAALVEALPFGWYSEPKGYAATFHRGSEPPAPLKRDEAVERGWVPVFTRAALAQAEAAQPVALPPCDPEVFERGESVCLLAVPKEHAEAACKIASALTGDKYDWHYIAGRVHVKRLAAPQPAEAAPAADLARENAELRHLLAVRVAGALLYADDGELQDASESPAIDFKRDAPGEISRKLTDRGLKWLTRPAKAARVHALVNAGPYPGMSEAFDAHMGAACWTDLAYRQDAATWAAAWKAALSAAEAAPKQEALSETQWLKRWTAHSGERLKPGARRDGLLSIFRFAERVLAQPQQPAWPGDPSTQDYASTQPQQPAPADSVKIPASEAEAELMQKVGHAWLKQHAQHRLVPQQPAPEPVARGWISVEDRLPDPDSGEVLVWLSGGMYALDEWHTHREDPTGMSTVHTLEMGCMWRIFDFEEVTHWMPLPVTPQTPAGEKL